MITSMLPGKRQALSFKSYAKISDEKKVTVQLSMRRFPFHFDSDSNFECSSPQKICEGGSGMRTVNKPDKLLLNNPNLFHTLCAAPNIGAIRETFFASQLSHRHQVHYHDQGDFIVDDRFIFAIGGAGKTASQLGNQADSYIAADDIETGAPGQIPLWIVGMGY